MFKYIEQYLGKMVQKVMVCVKHRATLGFWYWTERAIHKIYSSKAAFWVGLVRGCTVTALMYQRLFCIKHLCFYYVYFWWYLERDHSKGTLIRSQRIISKVYRYSAALYTGACYRSKQMSSGGNTTRTTPCAALNLRNYVTGNQPSHCIPSCH